MRWFAVYATDSRTPYCVCPLQRTAMQIAITLGRGFSVHGVEYAEGQKGVMFS